MIDPIKDAAVAAAAGVVGVAAGMARAIGPSVRVDADEVQDAIGKVRALLEGFPKPDEVTQVSGNSTVESRDVLQALSASGFELALLVQAISKDLDVTTRAMRDVVQRIAEAEDENAAEMRQFVTLIDSAAEIAAGSSSGDGGEVLPTSGGAVS